MKYGSVCSGIEAATVAWHPLGWEPQFFSEIEPFPCQVLSHHYGSNIPGEKAGANGVPNHGDMTKFQDWPDHAIELLVGGTPCQSFSVAGLRAGLADPRGNLMLTYLAIAARYRPRWLVWENVPGVLSSWSFPDETVDLQDGEEREVEEVSDFGCLLEGLQQLGYGFAYRILDAQYVRVDGLENAVPQRRRRVFVVGYLGDWRRAAAVLFDTPSLRGDPAPRREAGKDIAPTISARTKGGGGLGTDFDLDGGLLAFGGNDTRGDIKVATAVNAHGGPAGRLDFESETFVAHSLRAEGFDASEDGTGRGTPIVPVISGAILKDSFSGGAGGRPEGAAAGHCIAFNSREDPEVTFDRSGPLGASTPQAQAVAIQAGALRENPDSGPDGIGVQEGIAYTVEARAEVQAVAFDMRGREGGAQFEGPHDTANIRAANGGSSKSYVAESWAVRRLTPKECARLQGYPDDYLSSVKYRGKAPADGPMYKGFGNSMATNVMRWIGERIEMVDAL